MALNNVVAVTIKISTYNDEIYIFLNKLELMLPQQLPSSYFRKYFHQDIFLGNLDL